MYDSLFADIHTLHARPDMSARDTFDPFDLSARLANARPRLTRLAYLRGISPDDAEDLVQEALLTAWRTIDRLRDPRRFDAWLDGILRNYCRRHVEA
jgi:DNA-directed RNA polymerase specialized sigma24 family protein